ncbi:MAG: molecular chaperone TorD family protein [Gammaproteobacteria bacterium]|nr:molecular chaperone TorD family protein [Gammaproteobacteria bacterium]
MPAGALAEENQYRAAAYGLIAGLLRTAPDDDLLQRVAQLSPKQQGGDELALAMQMLGLAARTSTADAVKTEFYHLFIGLGRGELMPYASWYLTGFLMEKPLSLLRSDLVRLGFERQGSVREPEDHIAALCEVMLMLITDHRGYEVEFGFFDTHIAPWVDRFFTDLSVARSAVFYRNLGRFGAAFFELERRYFSIELPVSAEREGL